MFKNAIDWLSRPPADIKRVFRGKPVALMGASPGGFGTILSQNAWLPVLRTLGAELWTEGRLLVSRAQHVFNHLIVTHEVTNVGTDRAQLAHMADQAKATLERSSLDAIADRGYFSSEEILKCEQAGITVSLPKPMTSNAKAEGRFGKQDFRYVAEDDVYICQRGARREERNDEVALRSL